MSRLGDAIRNARIAKKWSEKQLGRKCGMAESVIREIESAPAPAARLRAAREERRARTAEGIR